MSEEEIWKPVVGWEGLYEVSSFGRVFNPRTQRYLKPWVDYYGYHRITASGPGGRRKHLKTCRMVLQAFKGLAPDEATDNALHWDGDKSNNRLENLRWGTSKDNAQDAVRQGLNARSRRTHCKYGHKFTPENTVFRRDRPNARECRTCRTKTDLRRRLRREKLEPPNHGTVNGYVSHKCRCGDCKSVYSDYLRRWRSGKSQTKSGE